MVNDRSVMLSSGPRQPGQDFIERMILRSMNEGVITLECDGSIHTVNPAVQRILGFEENDVKGKHFETVFSNDPVLAESDYFDIRFETAHCKHIPGGSDHCPGSISACAYEETKAQCPKANGTTSSVLFR